MELRLNIEQELWDAIKKNYENENYTGSILDAIHFLTETIRNKTGLEGDGSGLIGQAFGGNNPKLQLNKLQTDSEKNIQKGMQELLRGIYTAVRNPRSHDKHSDTKEDADSIIFFIGYLLKMIDKSKTNFEQSAFLERVFEEHYVCNNEYADLLVKEIPKRQRANIAISILLERKNGNIDNLEHFMNVFLQRLEDADIDQIMKVISEELKYTNSHSDIKTILHIVPPTYWSKVDKVVKIRIENMLLKEAKKGKFDSKTNKCRFGALATWVKREHIEQFEDVGELTLIIIDKLESGDSEEIEYVDKFLWDKICSVNNTNIHSYLYMYLRDGLLDKDEDVIERLRSEIIFDENHPWWEVFKKELRDCTDIQYVELPF